MTRYQPLAILLLRLATAANFLSAVAGRLGYWGTQGSDWPHFLTYTAQVDSFAPASLIPFLAITATVLEVIIAVLLIIGYKTRWAALTGALLTLLFAIAMTISFGFKSAMDYSVLVDSTSALLLATMPAYRWSIDAALTHKTPVYAS